MTLTGAADREILLSARAVGRRYGSRVALAPTDLDLRAGDIVALIGPNGAGKSTLLSILAGALAPSEGRVVAHDPSPTVGWVPQRPAQYGRLSARENLQLFARLEGVADPVATADRVLGLVELPRDRQPAGQLSIGNQQRLNLAIALLTRPDVLLLDEPTASLDPKQRRRLWELASDVTREGGAVLFASQNLEEMESFADRVAVLLDGSLVFEGTLAEYGRSPEAQVFA